jgi:hypothetical protein
MGIHIPFRPPVRRALPQAMLLALAVLTTAAPARAGTPPVLSLSSAWEVFHDSDIRLCGSTLVHIDSPVRAFKDPYGLIHMTIADPVGRGWQWTGRVSGFVANPNTATLDCTPVMEGYSGNNQVDRFDQKTFLQGFYFRPDTGYVYGYGHEDYFGTRLDDPDCHKGGVNDGKPVCWYSAVAIWKADTVNTSPAGHLHFVKYNSVPWHIAIYPHVVYPGDANTPLAGWIGYGAPSNLVRGRNPDGSPDGYTYMFAYTSSGYGAQDKGVCLFRSSDPSVRGSWRAWDGNLVTPGFTQPMNNPYISGTAPCAVVNPLEFDTYVRSVHWHAPSGHFIAVFRDEDGVRYATSTDLIHWNPSQMLFVSNSNDVSYPVLLDFDSGSAAGTGDYNFDSVYGLGRTYLFYRTHVATGHTQVKRRRIDIINY